MESQEDDRTKIAEVLLRGRDFTWQLKNTLENQPSPHPSHPNSSSPEQLLNNILLSLADTISILTSGDELSQPNPVNSPKYSAKKSDDSVDSCRSSLLAKERRGCYKRRKTAQTWMRTTPTLVDDGFAWRKYGQKVILNAKHPRNYYRCTHKFDQGCMATKQVQKTDTEPAMYQVTYSGSHCCNNLMGSPQIIIDSEPGPPSSNGSILLSFNHHTNDHNGFYSIYDSFNGASTPPVSSHFQDGGAILNQGSSCSEQDRYLQFTSVLDGEDVLSGLDSGTGSNQGSSDIDILVNHVDFYDGMFDF